MSEKDFNEFDNINTSDDNAEYTQPTDEFNAEAPQEASIPETDKTNVYSESVNQQAFDSQQSEETPKPDYSEPISVNSQSAQSVPPVQTYADFQQQNIPRYNTYGTSYPTQMHQGYYYPPQNGAPVQKAKKKKKSVHLTVPIIAVVLSVTVLASALLGFGGGMLANSLNRSKISDSLTINKVTPVATETGTNTESGLSTAQISEMTADSVVEIVTEVVQTNAFYQQYITSGAGSGVIISSDGHIVTNNHVIEDASKITVTLRDGKSYDAKLIGTDSKADVALIKIDPDEELKVAAFGDSSTVKVGDKTVAIGNPLGRLGGTVTDGIISALDRDITIDGKTMNLMQTNAAINPGNSGGGLFNDRGELIGLVVAKSSGTQIEGLGFAIPINDVIDILDDLKQYGYVRGRVSLGVTIVDVTSQETAMMYGVSELGAYVSNVELNSNASRAGIQNGDRIVALNGQEISEKSDIDAFLKTVSVGDTLEITAERNGRTGTLSVVLEEDKPEDSEESDSNNGSNFGSEQFPDNEHSGGSILDDILDRFGF